MAAVRPIARSPRLGMHVLKWVAWAALGALVLYCWMVFGVAVLAGVNYLVLGPNPKRLWETPARIAYAELPALTFTWPLVLLVATTRVRMLNRSLLAWLALMGLVSLFAGGLIVCG